LVFSSFSFSSQQRFYIVFSSFLQLVNRLVLKGIFTLDQSKRIAQSNYSPIPKRLNYTTKLSARVEFFGGQ